MLPLVAVADWPPPRLVGEITDTELIARGVWVGERARLRAQFKQGSWRKLKGIALVELPGGTL